MKDTRLVKVAEHAYCLTHGLTDVDDMDDAEKEYWANVTQEDIELASHWKIVLTGPLYAMLMKYSVIDYERFNPYPGGPTLKTDDLETFRIDGTDDYAMIWRDVCITWYKRPGRCMCMSRDITDEEMVQFEKELIKALSITTN